MSLAPLNPIQILPARDRVAAALREAILSHQFAEGEELTLKDTAAQLEKLLMPLSGLSLLDSISSFPTVIVFVSALLSFSPSDLPITAEGSSSPIRKRSDMSSLVFRMITPAAPASFAF